MQPGRIESEWSGTAAATLRASGARSAYRERIEPFAALLEDYGGAASPGVAPSTGPGVTPIFAPAVQAPTPLPPSAFGGRVSRSMRLSEDFT